MLKELKRQVWRANQDLVRHGLVFSTFGNASGIDRASGMLVIKPSGVDYGELRPADMVVVDLDGKAVEGKFAPSSDTPTHVALYLAFPGICGVAHTHSAHATAFAQAGREIPALGTTHADYFAGSIPVTRFATEAEVAGEYEANTGKLIAERFAEIDPKKIPAVLVAGHGPFAWGKTPAEAVQHVFMLEELARIAWLTLALEPSLAELPAYIRRRHFERKHGMNAYYGQKKRE